MHHILRDGINPNIFEFARAAQSSFIVQSNNAHAPRTEDIAHGEVQSGGRREGGGSVVTVTVVTVTVVTVTVVTLTGVTVTVVTVTVITV